MLNPAWLFLMQRTDAKPRSLMQEHKRIPYIVALLGLHDEQLFWGAEPDSQVRRGTQSPHHGPLTLIVSAAGTLTMSDVCNAEKRYCQGHIYVSYVHLPSHRQAIKRQRQHKISWQASDAENALASQEDERTNYSAIWVFTPRERTLEVFKQFEVTEELGATEGSGTAALTLLEPPGGYSAVARTLHLNPVPDHGNNDEEGRDDDRDYDDDDDDNQH